MPTSTVAVFLFRLHRGKKSARRTLDTAAYRSFVAGLDPKSASRIRFIQKDLRLTEDLKRLRAEISRPFSKPNKTTRRILLLELLGLDADVYAYDDLCSAIHDALMRDEKPGHPWCVGIVVSNLSTFKESEFLKRRLQPFCRKQGIGLIVVGCTDEAKVEFFSYGKLPRIRMLPDLPTCRPQKRPREPQQILQSPQQIESDFHLLFGHFEVAGEGTKYHVPAVASVKKLADNKVFVQQVNKEIVAHLGRPDYQVFSQGIPLGGIEDLSAALIEGNFRRRLLPDYSNLLHDSAVVLLCDFIMSAYPIERRCAELRNSGAKDLLIVGVGSYIDAPRIQGVQTLTFVTTSYEAAPAGPGCRFCEQGVPTIRGEDYESFARQVGGFDPFTFWELVKEHPDYYQAGHWISDRTPNHYQFRIMVKPMLQRHCHGFSLRMKNALESRGILSKWIDKIMCTEGEESMTLADGLANVVGLSSKDVIAIPRRHFASIAGADVGEQLWRFLDATYGRVRLRHQNVAIVDQAAHHFKTLTALRTVCDRLDSTILAFVVLVDRTDAALELGEYLHDSHYVPLYSWSSPPRLRYECPCAEMVE